VVIKSSIFSDITPCSMLKVNRVHGVISQAIEPFKIFLSPQTCQTVCTHIRNEEQHSAVTASLWKGRPTSDLYTIRPDELLSEDEARCTFIFIYDSI
jgi:hypothetical protein